MNPHFSIHSHDFLTLHGCAVSQLASWDHPVYVVDETLVRKNLRAYRKSLNDFYPQKSHIFYASKAFLNLAMAQLVLQEGESIDACSEGELFIAQKAGVPGDRMILHGNNKMDRALHKAIHMGVFAIVAEGFYDIDRLIQHNQSARLLLRINPEVTVDTHPSIATGVQGSKFGTPIREALPLIEKILKTPHLSFLGLHCHIGSKILDFKAYSDALYQVFQFVAHLKSLGISVPVVNIGGGLGINVLACSQEKITDWVRFIAEKIREYCKKWDLDLPVLAIEPGRSVVEQAGMTLYHVGHVKESESERIIAVNGGMADNIRTYLFGALYHAILPDRMGQPLQPKPCRIVGNCCESGDVLIHEVFLPECQAGDVMAVLNTGAYCHSLASFYNKYQMPSIVFINEAGVRTTVTQASAFEQMIQNDAFLEASPLLSLDRVGT